MYSNFQRMLPFYLFWGGIHHPGNISALFGRAPDRHNPSMDCKCKSKFDHCTDFYVILLFDRQDCSTVIPARKKQLHLSRSFSY